MKSKFANIVGLKQALNMISNSVMIKVRKVYGNLMIDVNCTNKKLVDRAVRIIIEVLNTTSKPIKDLSHEKVKQVVIDIKNKRKVYSINLPSTVKIAIIMLYKSVDMGDAIKMLIENNQNLQKILI